METPIETEVSKEEVKPLKEIFENKTDNNDALTELPKEQTKLRFLGEAFNTYIIVEKNDNEVLIIDKHAAHERIIYEKLKADSGSANVQYLLTPITVTLDKIDYDAAVSNLDMFAKCSFDVEDFWQRHTACAFCSAVPCRNRNCRLHNRNERIHCKRKERYLHRKNGLVLSQCFVSFRNKSRQ